MDKKVYNIWKYFTNLNSNNNKNYVNFFKIHIIYKRKYLILKKYKVYSYKKFIDKNL